MRRNPPKPRQRLSKLWQMPPYRLCFFGASFGTIIRKIDAQPHAITSSFQNPDERPPRTVSIGATMPPSRPVPRAPQIAGKLAGRLFQPLHQSGEWPAIFARWRFIAAMPRRIRPKIQRPVWAGRWRSFGRCLEKLVPEARLELARLASEVFETSASTIPPLGPARQGLSGPEGGVNGGKAG